MGRTATSAKKVRSVPSGKRPGRTTVRGSTAVPEAPSWTFLSNHAHVLLLIAGDPEIRLRDVAERVGITERAVQRIVSDLEQARYLERERTGRRNRYRVHANLPLRHPIESHRDVGALLALILER